MQKINLMKLKPGLGPCMPSGEEMDRAHSTAKSRQCTAAFSTRTEFHDYYLY